MIRVRMSDGRELLGWGEQGGQIKLVGQRELTSQFTLDLDRPTHWAPMDERTLEEFENG
jgi:hypothetical protein